MDDPRIHDDCYFNGIELPTPEQVMYDALAERGWAAWAEGEDITLMQGMRIALAALSAAGYTLVRLEDCQRLIVGQDATGTDSMAPPLASIPSGRYALVPVEVPDV